MSKRKDDGGTAFPFVYEGPTTGPEVYSGMSLRDWFAGMALVGLLQGVDEPNEGYVAMLCYKMADAMIERKNET